MILRRHPELLMMAFTWKNVDLTWAVVERDLEEFEEWFFEEVKSSEIEVGMWKVKGTEYGPMSWVRSSQTLIAQTRHM